MKQKQTAKKKAERKVNVHTDFLLIIIDKTEAVGSEYFSLCVCECARAYACTVKLPFLRKYKSRGWRSSRLL
jgi:hypothetical protein